MVEYGGFITTTSIGKEYFSNIDEKKIQRFNAARYAICEAVKDGNYNKIWIPFYMCRSVYDALDREKIDYEVYHIDEKLEPELGSIGSNECILITNYAGIKDYKYYERMCNQFENVIFDNTQAFFAKPIWKEHVYNVYSPRKFFSVCDGAYLISEKLEKQCTYVKDYSYKRAMFLIKAVELGNNAVYSEYLQCEEELDNSGVRQMSEYTKRVLSNIDYEKIEMIRKDNFQYIQKELNDINEFNMDIVENSCPMVYPLIISKAKLRNILVQNHIYIPRWWRWILDDNPNQIEQKLAKYLLPIPIDQRYTYSDIKKVCDLIKNNI